MVFIKYKVSNSEQGVSIKGPSDSEAPSKVKEPVEVKMFEDGDETEGLGRYQLAQATLALLPVLCTAMSQVNFVFAAATVEKTCIFPEDGVCPAAAAAAAAAANTTECSQWVYANNNSIVAEFGLACRDWQRALVGTVHNIGVMLSMLVMGYVSDRWGRRPSIVLSGVGLTVGALKTLVSGPLAYQIYVAVEFLEAAIATGVYSTSFIFILELIGSAKRTLSSTALGITISLGQLVMVAVVWTLPYWRHMLLAVYLPGLLFLSYPFLLDESPRWLHVTGRTKQANELRKKIARWNGLPEPKPLQEIEKPTKSEGVKEPSIVGLLLSSSVLRKRLIICGWWWFSMALVFYGMIFSSVSLPGSREANFAMAALAMVPGELLAPLALRLVGRRPTLMAGFLLSGACCVTAGLIPDGQNVWQISVYLFGISAAALSFNSAYTGTAELLPTTARGAGLGACSMMARVGAALAPLLPLLKVYWRGAPLCVMGASTLAAGALVLLVPETGRRALPDTVAQATAD